jgi:hypothetical protein
MTCMIWGGCLSEYLFAFLHDTHAYLAAHHGACLGNTRNWTDYSFPFFVTSTHAAHHGLYLETVQSWMGYPFLSHDIGSRCTLQYRMLELQFPFWVLLDDAHTHPYTAEVWCLLETIGFAF